MSQTAIGKAALVLTTDAAGARTGLADFKTQSKQIADQTAAGIRGSFSGIFRAGLFGAVTGAVGGFIEDQTRRIKELAGVGRQAAGLGIKSDQFMGLSGALKRVGVEGSAVTMVFSRLGRVTTEAAAGHAGAAEALDRLGLSAREMAALPLDQQFLRAADAINKLPPGGQQAAAAMDLFGRSGAQLLPVLQMGSEKLKAFVEHQKELGLALNPEEMTAVRAAADALPKMHKQWEGLLNRITVAFAPILEALFRVGKAVMSFLMPAFRALAEIIGTIAEIGEAVFSAIRDAVGGVVNTVVNWVRELFGLGQVHITIRDVIIGVFRAIGTVGAYAWDTIKAAAGGLVAGIGLIISALSYVTDAFADMVEFIRDAGAEVGIDIFKDWSHDVRDFTKGVEQAGRDLREWGANAVNGFGSSADKFNKWVDGIANKQKKTVAEVAAETAAAAATVEAALTKFDNAALVKGSQAEVSARLKAEFGGQTAQQQMLGEQKKANGHLKNIEGGVKKMGDKRPLVAIEEL